MNEAFPQLRVVESAAPPAQADAVALDAEGLAALFHSHRQALQGYFRRRIPDRIEAEDAVQDVYLRLLQSSTSAAVRQPQALVYAVARSVLVDRQRRDRSHRADRHVPWDVVELADPDADQEHSTGAQQELALLADVIAGLSPKCRRVFLLSRMHQRTYPEIAREVGISVQMVAKHVSNALAACRIALQGDGRSKGGR